MVVNLSKPKPPDPLNAALALAMIRGAGTCWGLLKVQKVAFWTEHRLLTEGLAGPTFPFIRYTYGPFSVELAATMDYLRTEGFVDHGKPFTLTERGTFVAGLCIDGLGSVDANERVLRTMKTVLHHCSTRNGEQLKAEAYDLKWRYGDRVVTTLDLPPGLLLLGPRKSDLEVPKWLTETLDEEFGLTLAEIQWSEAHAKSTMDESLRRLRELAVDC